MNTHATPTCTSHQIYHPQARQLASLFVRLAAVLILITITSCTPTPVAFPTASATAEPALPTSTPTPEPTPTPIVEPSPITSGVDDLLPITPPNFDTFVNLKPGPFDIVDAHAVYAWYRQQVGPRGDDADFLSAMETYAGELGKQGIALKQATVEGQTFSLLTKGTQILLNFDASGALKDSDPGYWNSESTSEWIDAGGPVELFIGDDGHAYIGKLDAEGNVIAYLNPIGATLDNLDSQWIPVEAGQATQQWFGELGWIDASLTAQTEQGPVIVKDDKLYLFDASSLKNREVDIDEVVFSTTGQAQKAVLALHAEKFEDQEQLLLDLFPNGYPSDTAYKWYVLEMGSGYDDHKNFNGIVGICEQIVTVNNPLLDSPYPHLVTAMLNVYGYKKPLPLAVGAIDRQGRFISTTDLIFVMSPADYSSRAGRRADVARAGEFNLAQMKSLLIHNIFVFDTLTVADPEVSQDYTGRRGTDFYVLSHVAGELYKLLAQYQSVNLGEAGYQAQLAGQLPRVTSDYFRNIDATLPVDFDTPLYVPDRSQFSLITP